MDAVHGVLSGLVYVSAYNYIAYKYICDKATDEGS